MTVSACSSVVPCIETMTVEEKVGQLLMVHFNGEEANEAAATLINEAHVGGVIYFNWSNGLKSPSQVLSLSAGLQNLASKTTHGIPLLIAVDQEGGVVTRLKEGFTVYPGNGAVAKTGDPFLAKRCAKAMGEELKAVGINMTLGPVADVNVNPYNPVIGVRSFGSTPERVAAYAKAALEGYREAGIMTVLKHFPGHGDVTMDSHLALPIVDKSCQELERVELYPFSSLAQETDAMMTAHLLIPALDPFRCATLSDTIIKGTLRKSIGFDGVVMTDSLVMKGFLTHAPDLAEASIEAFNAGSDILMLGGKQLLGKDGFELTSEEVMRIYKTLVGAVYEGRITMERLDASVLRILRMKTNHGLFESSHPSLEGIAKKVNTVANRKLAREVAIRAISSNSDENFNPIEFGNLHVAVIAPKIIQYDLNLTTLAQIGRETKTLFFENLGSSSNRQSTLMDIASWADAIIVCSYNAWRNEDQARTIEMIIEMGKPVTLIALRDPQDSVVFKNSADIVISTSSPDAYSIQSAVDILTGVFNVQ